MWTRKEVCIEIFRLFYLDFTCLMLAHSLTGTADSMHDSCLFGTFEGEHKTYYCMNWIRMVEPCREWQELFFSRQFTLFKVYGTSEFEGLVLVGRFCGNNVVIGPFFVV